MPNDVQLFVNGFIEAALWSSTYEHENCADCVEGCCNPHCDDGTYELSEGAYETLSRLARKFFEVNQDMITSDNLVKNVECGKCAYAGHDAWLTSQGHGAGFWDGDWNEPAATRLTQSAKTLIPSGIDFYISAQNELEIDVM